MIKRFCFNGLKLKLIVISFFRDRKGPQQPVSNQRLREGASQSARSCRSPHHTHRKSLCSCQRTSRGECLPFPNNYILSCKGLFWTEMKKASVINSLQNFIFEKHQMRLSPCFLSVFTTKSCFRKKVTDCCCRVSLLLTILMSLFALPLIQCKWGENKTYKLYRPDR